MARTSRVLGSAALLVTVLGPVAALAGPAVLRHLPGDPPDVNSFVLTSPRGVKVFLDVNRAPADLAAALDDPKNLMVATHSHPDHYSAAVEQKFKGQKRVADPGTLASGDVEVEIVPSSHIDNEIDGRSNTIVVVDLAGFRVVHLGDCAQDTLTPDQRKRIGRVDVMIGQFENGHADVNTYNRSGYKVMAQLAPTIVIPTHLVSQAAVELFRPAYGYAPEWAQKDEMVLSKELLAKGKRAVFMGGNVALAKKAGAPASQDL